MQRILSVRKQKAISKKVCKDEIEGLTSTESNLLCFQSNYFIGFMFSSYQAPSTIYKNERAN
jgi:hypothetical protein